jgi:hypothetical protein
MSNSVQYKGRTPDLSRGLSSGVWADCPIEDIINGNVDGIFMDDTFLTSAGITAVTADASLVGLPYRGFNSAGGTHTQPDVAGGELALTEATANEANFIRSTVSPFQISSALGDMWFEARVKVSSITNVGMIVGLWDNVSNTVDIPLSASDPPIMATTGNFVGFRMPEGAGSVDTIYKADGVAVVAGQTVNSAVATLVAETYVKLGMRFDRRTGLLSWFVNGVKAANTKAIPNNTGTDFPADVRLGLLFGQKLVATAAGVSTIDRWTCAQLFV